MAMLRAVCVALACVLVLVDCSPSKRNEDCEALVQCHTPLQTYITEHLDQPSNYGISSKAVMDGFCEEVKTFRTCLERVGSRCDSDAITNEVADTQADVEYVCSGEGKADGAIKRYLAKRMHDEEAARFGLRQTSDGAIKSYLAKRMHDEEATRFGLRQTSDGAIKSYLAKRMHDVEAARFGLRQTSDGAIKRYLAKGMHDEEAARFGKSITIGYPGKRNEKRLSGWKRANTDPGWG